MNFPPGLNPSSHMPTSNGGIYEDLTAKLDSFRETDQLRDDFCKVRRLPFGNKNTHMRSTSLLNFIN